MRDRKQQVALLFWKFGLLGVNELQKIYGERPARRQLNRYLVELTKEGRIGRLCHPSRYIFAYEATPQVLGKHSKERAEAFQKQNKRQIAHRIACAETLVNLCRRSRVQGVAIEHELNPDEVREFCMNRTPDGIVRVIDLWSDPQELAVEIESTPKTNERVREILDSYHQTIDSKRHRCHGVMFFATEQGIHKQYKKLIGEYPESFQKRVVLSLGTSTEDIKPHVLGATFESALGHPGRPCLSRRSASREGISYERNFSEVFQ